MIRRKDILVRFMVVVCVVSIATGVELPTGSPEEVGLSSARLVRVSSFIQGYLDREELAGAVAMVARRGKVVLADKFGWQDIESGVPMRMDTIFRIYSMTKPMTTVGAMILFEEGKFRLNDPVSRYIPEFTNLQVLEGSENSAVRQVNPSRQMTIRDLMTHTAGFSYGVFGDTEVDRRYRESEMLGSEFTLKDMIDRLAKTPLQYHPGRRWHYSVSVDVLGYLIEVISGMPLDRFLEERILQPLDMKDTGFWVPADKLDRFATCYGPFSDEERGQAEAEASLKVIDHPKDSRYVTPARFLSGGGGLVSTARDYMRFCQMLLNGGDLDGTRILGRKTVELMTQNHLRGSALDLESSNGFGFGLGFAVLLDVPRSEVTGTVGEYNWGGYASTLFWVDPEEELIAILMTQYIPSGTYPLRADFKAALYPALID